MGIQIIWKHQLLLHLGVIYTYYQDLILAYYPYLSKHSVIKNLIIFIIIHTIYECKDLYITYIISNNKKYDQNTLINSIGIQYFLYLGGY